jgi:hypothetical protein
VSESPCEHALIKTVGDQFICEDCGEPVVLKTKSSIIITPADIERWVTEAERGYK